MPSAPKILKESIIETAFQILLSEGYSEVNIKNVAKKLNCSTQPISWQFGNMENFRKALLDYCIEYVNQKFSVISGAVEDIIKNIAEVYIDIALDTPNLYRYLYMGGQSGEEMSLIARRMRYSNYNKVIDLIKDKHDISYDAALGFMQDLEFYVHGLASYISTGFADLTKEDVIKRIQCISNALIIDKKTLKD